MQALLNGISWGLFLAILVGPVLFILVQAGIERGFRAGAMIASGMWVSDLCFIALTWFSLSYLLQASEWSGFEPLLGVLGGLILIVLGISTLRSQPPISDSDAVIGDDYVALWLKGFVVNTVNPFCVFFWVMIGTTVVSDSYAGSGAMWFYAGIVSAIVVTDCLKVGLAKGLRKWLTADHVSYVRKGTAILLLLVGIAFIGRTFLG